MTTMCADCGIPVYRRSIRCRSCVIARNRQALDATFPARFWSRVRVGGVDECWPWQERSRQRSGYGCVAYPGLRRPIGAHRVALELKLGRALEPGEQACHACDNPPCCNPLHLFVGSQTDNLADMRSKGRSAKGDKHSSRTHPDRVARGSSHGNAKLVESDIPVIRARAAAGEPYPVIAADFSVHPGTITKIVLGHRWRHVA